MDGKGRGLDIVFIERRWRSLMGKVIYLKAHGDLVALEAGIRTWFDVHLSVPVPSR